MKPCKTPSEIVERQAIALKEAILEAKNSEKQRIHKLAISHSREREVELEKRFAQERAREQDYIKQLMSDLENVKSKAAAGTLLVHQGGPNKVKTMDTNRFSLFETAEELRFRKAFAEKLQKHDQRFESRQNRGDAFDYYDEKKKCSLLKEKTSVLKQLVTMNMAELAARGENCYGLGDKRNVSGGSKSNSSWDTQSNASSIASHATFASRSSSGVHRVANTSRNRNIAVPKLNMNAIRK